MDKQKVVEKLKKMSGLMGVMDCESKLIAYYQGAVDQQTMITCERESFKIIWRDLTEVKQAVAACLTGEINYDHQIAFSLSPKQVVYSGELEVGVLLWERANKPLSLLKQELHPFPRKMKVGLITYYSEQIDRELKNSYQAVPKGDSHYIVGSFFKIVSYWNHLLFTLNDRYLLDQLGAVKQIDKLKLKPSYYLVRVEQAYQYFASHDISLGFEEYQYIQEEISHLLKENS